MKGFFLARSIECTHEWREGERGEMFYLCACHLTHDEEGESVQEKETISGTEAEVYA